MNIKKYLPVLFLFILCVSCNEDREKCEKCFTIDLSSLDAPSIKEIFFKVEIVELESKENSIIGEALKYLLYEDNYFIMDGLVKNIKVFDSEGKYLRSIGKVGFGPAEYNVLRDFFISDDVLYVLAIRPAKVLLYDLDGSHITSYSLPEELATSQDFIKADDNSMLFYSSFAEGEVLAYDFMENNITSILPKKPEWISYKTSFNGGRSTSFLKYIDDRIIYFQPHTNNVYQYDEGNLRARTIWDFGQYNFNVFEDISQDESHDYYMNFTANYSDKYAFSFFNYDEIGKYIITSFVHNEARITLIYNSDTKEYHVLEYTEEGILIPGHSLESYNNEFLYGIIPQMHIEKVYNGSVEIMDKLSGDINEYNNPVVFKYYLK